MIPIIIGHRGACGYELENSIKSFQAAIDLHVDMVEFDIRLCKSGELVVIHDETLDRIAGIPLKIAGLTWQELEQVSIGSGQKILSLRQALEFIDNRCKVNIEVKEQGLAKEVLKIVKAYIADGSYAYNDVLISSFFYEEMQYYRFLDSKILLAGIFDKVVDDKFWSFAGEYKLYSVHSCSKIATKELVKKAHSYDLKNYVYTVNTRAEFLNFTEMGVDGVFSDVPDVIRL